MTTNNDSNDVDHTNKMKTKNEPIIHNVNNKKHMNDNLNLYLHLPAPCLGTRWAPKDVEPERLRAYDGVEVSSVLCVPIFDTRRKCLGAFEAVNKMSKEAFDAEDVQYVQQALLCARGGASAAVPASHTLGVAAGSPQPHSPLDRCSPRGVAAAIGDAAAPHGIAADQGIATA